MVSLRAIDSDLYIDLLILVLRANWEGYPTNVTSAPAADFSPMLMWMKWGE